MIPKGVKVIERDSKMNNSSAVADEINTTPSFDPGSNVANSLLQVSEMPDSTFLRDESEFQNIQDQL